MTRLNHCVPYDDIFKRRTHLSIFQLSKWYRMSYVLVDKMKYFIHYFLNVLGRYSDTHLLNWEGGIGWELDVRIAKMKCSMHLSRRSINSLMMFHALNSNGEWANVARVWFQCSNSSSRMFHALCSNEELSNVSSIPQYFNSSRRRYSNSLPMMFKEIKKY